jgi:hypothetical protein
MRRTTHSVLVGSGITWPAGATPLYAVLDWSEIRQARRYGRPDRALNIVGGGIWHIVCSLITILPSSRPSVMRSSASVHLIAVDPRTTGSILERNRGDCLRSSIAVEPKFLRGIMNLRTRVLRLLAGAAIALAVAAAVVVTGAAPAQAIMGNAPQVAVDDHTYDFVGLLSFRDKPNSGSWHSCTTELVAPDVAITAQHCVKFAGFLPTAEIVFGATRRSTTVDNALPDGTRYKVASVDTAGSVDIALLHLTANVVRITPVQIAPTDVGNAFQRGARATLVGWGNIDEPGTATSELRFADHVVTARNRDQGFHTPGVSVTTNPVTKGQWGTHGDSGGALVARTPNGTLYLHAIFVARYPEHRVFGLRSITDNYSINIGANGRWGIHDWVTTELDTIAKGDAPS